MTRLRQCMLEKLQRRNYSPSVTRGFILAVKQFAAYFGKSPDRLGAEQVRRFPRLTFAGAIETSPGSVPRDSSCFIGRGTSE